MGKMVDEEVEMAGAEAKNASQELACLHSIVRPYSKQEVDPRCWQ